MAAGNSYFLGINSNDFFLKDNKKAFILWLNVPKVTAYDEHVSVDQDLAAKAVFIEILKDLSPNLDKGGTTNNIRQRIQDAWSKRPNKKN